MMLVWVFRIPRISSAKSFIVDLEKESLWEAVHLLVGQNGIKAGS